MNKFLEPSRLEVEPAAINSSEEWEHWFRTFQNFLDAVLPEKPDSVETCDVSKVDAASHKQKVRLVLLINYVSPTVYKFISDCKTYDEAIVALKKLYEKPKNEIFARYTLAVRRQQSGESIDQFLQALKELSKPCNFKAVTADKNRDDSIRDAFITGLASSQIRQRLLESQTLELEDIYNQALILESAAQYSSYYGASSLNSMSDSEIYVPKEVNKDTTQVDTSHTHHSISVVAPKCFFCGGIKHPRFQCPAKYASCKACNKVGHFAKVCRSKSKIEFSTPSTTAACRQSYLASAPPCLSKSIMKVTVNDIELDALVDTGSSESFINSTIVKQKGLKAQPTLGSVAMASTSLSSTIKECCVCSVEIQGHRYERVKLLVLPKLCADVIIGHDLLKYHSSIEVKFGGNRDPLTICGLTAAQVKPAQLFTNLKPGIKPVAIKSRRYSKADHLFIKEEIQKLLKEGVIEPSQSPWRAQVLVTQNEHHKKRMVIDYSQTINRFTLLDAYPLPRIDDLVNRVASYNYFTTIDLKSAYHQIPIAIEDRPYTAFEACGKLFQSCRISFGLTNGVASFQRKIDEIIEEEQLQDTYAYLDDVTIGGKTKEQHDRNLNRFMETVRKYKLTINKNKSKFCQNSIKLLGYLIEDNSVKPDPERMRSVTNLQVPTNLSSLRRAVGMFAHYAKWIKSFSEKIHPITKCKQFPLPSEAIRSFEILKADIAKACMTPILDDAPFVVETDASEVAIGAALSQNGKPVAFFSRTLSEHERRHSSIEKEAYAMVEALRKWRHYLIGRHFTVITDQKSVSYMFNSNAAGKIKNDKIMRWRLELSNYSYDVVYRPGRNNTVADALSRVCSATYSIRELEELHSKLCHPGITRMCHWIRSKNLPFSVEEIRRVINSCPTCAQVKPRFFHHEGTLIKATQPFERLSLDFKGPLPSVTRNKYILTVIDEYSRFPFAFPCPNMTSDTVIKCLRQIFSVFGTPSYIHTDRGTPLLSREVKVFLDSISVASSRTTPYNPRGNGQCERYNGIIWQTVMLAVKSRGLTPAHWETVLDDVLYSIRSLLCTATNCTPHERIFNFQRKSPNGSSLPTWLMKPGKVLLRKNNRASKYEPLVEEVDLIESNPSYAHVRYSDGREDTVSTRHLAPSGLHIWRGGINKSQVDPDEDVNTPGTSTGRRDEAEQSDSHDLPQLEEAQETNNLNIEDQSTQLPILQQGERPSRKRCPPKYLEDYVTG